MQKLGLLEGVFCKRIASLYDEEEAQSQSLQQEAYQLQGQVNQLTREKADLVHASTGDKQALLAQIATLDSKISDLQAQNDSCNAQLNANMPKDPKNSATFSNLPLNTQTLLMTYMNKYPEAFVTYSGRYWGSDAAGTKTNFPLDVKAWLMEGQNDFAITSRVGEINGKVAQVLQANPKLTFHQACDIAYMRVTNGLGDAIQYTYDSQDWGVTEFWQFASETKVIGKGDCEDKAILNYVAARIAGIPWEMLRITAGETFDEQGHCTDFYYASDLKWHHRNSTTNYPADKTVTSLPLTGDSSESLNIKTPWFSATETKTFNWFGTEAQKNDTFERLKDDMFLKYLDIFRLGGRT